MKKIVILILVLIPVILIGGIFTEYYLVKKGITSKGTTSNPPLSETPPKVTLPTTLYNLAGSIKNLDKDSLTLEANIPFIDEKGEPISRIETRTAKITALTKFSRLAFVETESGKRVPKETTITFNDLKIGNFVEVIALEDISHAEEFEASQIRILP